MIAAINELFMGFDTYLAHGLNGTIRWNEWIPIIFGTVAGLLLLLAGLLAYHHRFTANLIPCIHCQYHCRFLGSYFHITRGAILPYEPMDERLNIALFGRRLHCTIGICIGWNIGNQCRLD